MNTFIGAAFAFPTAMFTVLLLAVVGYWLVVVLGALDVETLDGGDSGGDSTGDGGGMLSVVGLGGVPIPLPCRS